MRIRQYMFYDPIAAFTLRIGQAIKQAITLGVFGQVIEIALFLVAKRFAITHEKLKVARVRLVGPWIINLIDDAVTEREPEMATGMIGCAHALLRARSPAWLDSRRPKRHTILRRIHHDASREFVFFRSLRNPPPMFRSFPNIGANSAVEIRHRRT